MLRTRAAGGQGGPTRELLDFVVLLSWSTAALGFRPAAAVHAPRFFTLDLVRNRTLYFTSTAASVGVGISDMVVVAFGAGLVAFVEGVPQRSMGELGLFLAASSAMGLAISLQFELVRMFGKRSFILAVTALLAFVTLRAAQADLSSPLAFLGRLVFPVSGLASATEEPQRLDLAARALTAGVTYDLALIALLLALPGNRARGQQ